MLEYDNSAFYYFALSMMAIYLVPGTWYAVAEFFRAVTGAGAVKSEGRTKEEKEKIAKINNSTTGWARLNTTGYKVNLACLAVCWAIFLYLVALVSQNGVVTAFDPYQILGIEQGCEVSKIKKAYRQLSLKFHPDKNIGNKVAEEMFVRITKAYQALTDEASRENYEKYGNPDGKQALEVSIGLPRLLLDNPRVVLVLYLLGMVVAIPGAVAWWYYESKEYGEKNIKHDTYNTFHEILRGRPLEELPHHLAWSMEFRDINVPKPTDKGTLDTLFADLRAKKQIVSRLKDNQRALGVEIAERESRKILRGNVLLMAHLLRLKDRLSAEQKQDLLKMLTKTPVLMEAVIEMAFLEQWHHGAVTLIHFYRSIVQAVWPPQSAFHQLPRMTDAVAAALALKPQAKTLSSFLRLPGADQKAFLLEAGVGGEDVGEVLQACAAFPLIQVELKVFVEEEEEGQAAEDAARGGQVYENDLVTLRVTITRENVAEGGSAGLVYAPFFPATVHEGWWLMLLDRLPESARAGGRQPAVHAFEKVTDQKRVITHELRFMAPPHEGQYAMELQVISDSYLGLDESHVVSFSVLPASQLPEFKPHPDDLALDSEPTLFEQMMMAGNADEDSSDDEDEEEEEGEGAQQAAATKSAAPAPAPAPVGGKKKAVVVEDADSDSD